MCNNTGTTITDNGPSTAVVGGTTITSPYVALSIPALSAFDSCGLLGSVMTNLVVAVPPGELSTANGLGGHELLASYSLNYGDLAPNHLPASAWFQQPNCYSESMWSSSLIDATGAAWTSSFGASYPDCGTIWEDNYQPALVAPTQITQLQPQWAGCRAAFGLFDPPKV